MPTYNEHLKFIKSRPYKKWYVVKYGGLKIGDRTGLGPGVMIHTANHGIDPSLPIVDQGWEKSQTD